MSDPVRRQKLDRFIFAVGPTLPEVETSIPVFTARRHASAVKLEFHGTILARMSATSLACRRGYHEDAVVEFRLNGSICRRRLSVCLSVTPGIIS